MAFDSGAAAVDAIGVFMAPAFYSAGAAAAIDAISVFMAPSDSSHFVSFAVSCHAS
jgi:hypothetical protein